MAPIQQPAQTGEGGRAQDVGKANPDNTHTYTKCWRAWPGVGRLAAIVARNVRRARAPSTSGVTASRMRGRKREKTRRIWPCAEAAAARAIHVTSSEGEEDASKRAPCLDNPPSAARESRCPKTYCPAGSRGLRGRDPGDEQPSKKPRVSATTFFCVAGGFPRGWRKWGRRGAGAP